jgi:hypothetical protein
MAVTYTWKVVGLTKTNTDNLQDVVIGTRWEKRGVDEDGNEGMFSGATPFLASEVDPNNFVDWNNLTEELVLSWIQPVVVDGYEQHVNEQIQKQIDAKKNPVVDTNDLPWSPAPEPNNSPTP